MEPSLSGRGQRRVCRLHRLPGPCRQSAAAGSLRPGSDAGHKGGAEDASWSLNHPEKTKDFGWRAVHLTALRAKEVIKAYYSAPVQKAYFDSCSDGGREALMEAQRFPDDYDGILAGAPANAWTRMVSAGLSVTQGTNGPKNYIPREKLPAIERASLAACDAADGVKDGFLSDPAQCHFHPDVLLCKGADSPDCLTALQVQSLKRYYAGGVDDQGKSMFSGYVMGDEDGWRDWVVGKGPGTGSGVQYVKSYFRYMITGNPDWNVMTADVDASWQRSDCENCGRARCDQQRFNPLSGSRQQIDSLSRVGRSCDLALEHHCLLSVRPEQGGHATGGFVCTALHGAGYGTLCRWPRTLCLRPTGHRHHGWAKVRSLRRPRQLDRKGSYPANSDRDKIRFRQKGRDDSAVVPLPGSSEV